ncbi:MAG: FHA domain-containing protein [Deltaproteobacteria bacterium]|nr:FHA domain-containing protein [Deltaproteobacteria bacterium]
MRMFLSYRGDSIELAPGETILGRGLSCRIRFNDPAVSRQHVRLVVAGGSLTVEDLGSSNGTRVNGQPLTTQRALKDGDSLQVGNRQFRVHVIADLRGDESCDEDTLNRGDVWDGPTQADSTPGPEPLPPDLQRLASAEIRLGELTQQNCPRCRARAPIEAERCPGCGYEWPPGRPMSVTQRIRVEEAERRREPRHPVDVPVLYSSDSLTFDAVARDVSRGGMFVGTELLDAVGTACAITVLPDGHAAVTLTGVVAHVVAEQEGRGGRPPGMGVQFRTLDRGAETWLMQLIARAENEVQLAADSESTP